MQYVSVSHSNALLASKEEVVGWTVVVHDMTMFKVKSMPNKLMDSSVCMNIVTTVDG